MTALDEFPAPVIDRAGLERLLRVSRRQASRLMAAFGGYQAGRTALIGRQQLRQALTAAAEEPAVREQLRRRERVADVVERTRRDLAARRIELRPPPSASPAASLPAGVRLADGRCEVAYRSAEELLEQLLAIARAAAADFEKFKSLVDAKRPVTHPGAQVTE